MRKASNPRYLQFTRQETVVAFSTDRGQLRTNDNGEFFFRETPDGRFTCCSPDLERRLLNLNYHASEQVGITREPYGRSVIWKVRRIGAPVAEMPQPKSASRKPPARSNGFPKRLYAKVDTAANENDQAKAFPSTAPQHPAGNSGLEANQPITPAVAVQGPAREGPILAAPAMQSSSSNLITRCLVAAVDAAATATVHAKHIGFDLSFGPAEVERIAVTLYIQAQSTLQAPERKPNGRVTHPTPIADKGIYHA